MRLLTTQEFSGLLRHCYVRGSGELLGTEIHRFANAQIDGNLKELIAHAKESGTDFYHWGNDLAVIKYFIDNLVEEF